MTKGVGFDKFWDDGGGKGKLPITMNHEAMRTDSYWISYHS